MKTRVPMRWPDWIVIASFATVLVGLISVAWPTWITLSQADAEGVYRDTYYVVANLPYAAYGAGILAAVVVLYVTLLRRAGAKIAAASALAIVLFLFGMALATRPQAFLPRQGMPRRYIDYPEAFETMWLVSNAGAALSLVAFVTLTGLTLRALLKHRRSK